MQFFYIKTYDFIFISYLLYDYRQLNDVSNQPQLSIAFWEKSLQQCPRQKCLGTKRFEFTVESITKLGSQHWLGWGGLVANILVVSSLECFQKRVSRSKTAK